MHCSRFFSYLIWRCSLLNSKKYMTTSFLFMLVLLPKSIVANSYSQQFSFITTNGYVDFPTARKCTSSLAATIPKTYKCKNPYAWNNICILLIIWSSDQSKKFDWICLKTEENILSNTNGKQLMLAVYIKYTHLICMFTRERDRKKNVWNSYFFRDHSTCNASDGFSSRRSFFPFILVYCCPVRSEQIL